MRNQKRAGVLRRLLLLASLAACLLVAGCGGSGAGSTQDAAKVTAAPQHGGSLVVLEDAGYGGTWPTGLDPGTSTTPGGNTSLMDSIFGELFELGPNGKIMGDLASGYKLLHGGKTVQINIRPGVKFQDGTPFNAKAVAWNITRDLKSPCTCSPSRIWPALSKTDPVSVAGKDVQIHFIAPDPSAITSFINAAPNWIASPTAVKKMGAQAFKLKPVGAGPFEVVSDTISSKLALKRFSGYWQKGHPYLDKLTFQSIGSDESAYEAMQSNQAQAYEELWTPQLMKQAGSKFTVVQQPSTQPTGVQLNTTQPPFDNKLAREAMYYATDSPSIAKNLFHGLFPVTQSFTGPGGLDYTPTVPGYRTYDPSKAETIVKQLGGLSITLNTPNELPYEEMSEALQTMWKKVGIKTTIKTGDLGSNIQEFSSGKWQVFLQPLGSWDPTSAQGVAFRFGSHSPFSGVHDPKLDAMLNRLSSTLNAAKRKQIVGELAKYVSDQAYAPMVVAFSTASLADKNVTGPGLTTKIPAVALTPMVRWEDVGG